MSVVWPSTAAFSHWQPEAGGATGDIHDNLRDQGQDKRDILYNSGNTKALAPVLHQTKVISVYDHYLRPVNELVTSNDQSKVETHTVKQCQQFEYLSIHRIKDTLYVIVYTYSINYYARVMSDTLQSEWGGN